MFILGNRGERRHIEHESFEGLIAGRNNYYRDPLYRILEIQNSVNNVSRGCMTTVARVEKRPLAPSKRQGAFYQPEVIPPNMP